MEDSADLREVLKRALGSDNADEDVKKLEVNRVVTADVWCTLTSDELKGLGLSIGAFALLRNRIKYPSTSGGEVGGVHVDLEKLYISSQQDSCQSAFQTFLAAFSSELRYGSVVNFADIANHLPDGSQQINQLYLRKFKVLWTYSLCF